MRPLSSALAITAMTSAMLVAPVIRVDAAPLPVPPKITRISIPAASPTASQTAGPAGSPSQGRRVVASLTRTGAPFDVAGVTFAGEAPSGLTIEARVRVAATWGAWQTLGLSDSGPDPGTQEARRARVGTEPVIAPEADGIDIRVASTTGVAPAQLRADLIDSGASPSDSRLGAVPGSAVAAVPRPTIITRSQWGADESLRSCDPTPVARFKAAVVHHTVSSNSYTETQAAGIVRGIYAYHTSGLGWCDIGYQFLVDRFGRIYEGRTGNLTGNTQGAQASGFNAETFGVASIGDHQTADATSAAKDAIARVVAWKAGQNGFDPGGTAQLTSAGGSRYPAGTVVTLPRTMGHRDVNLTECPGDALYASIAAIRESAQATYGTGQWSQMAPARVEETFVRPTGTTVAVAGHGYGHGIGMSQWGAYGAATKALTWSQITAFYYPGTTVTAQGDPTVRVRLFALGSGGTTVPAQTGLALSDGSSTTTLSSTPTQWRIVPDGGGLTLQWRTSSGWVSSQYWKAWTRSPLTFSRPSTGRLRVMLPAGTQREYRGSVATVASGGAAVSVNVTTFEAYVRGVVPIEMPPSWPAAALEAQAVAARTFAAYGKRASTSAAFDTCDTTSCQGYHGVADYSSTGTLTRSWEDARSTAATAATAGAVLSYGGAPALTQFSSSNGGRTVRGSQPYLQAKVDPYDSAVASSANPTSWTTSVAISKVESAYPAVGSLRSIVVTGRSGGGDWSGRTTGVRVVGSSGTTSVSADAFRVALGLRSTWWTVVSAPPRSSATFPRDLTADRLPDAIVPSGGALTALAYNGTMTFTSRTMAPSGWAGMRLVAGIGPFDRDNLADVVAASSDGSLWLYPGNASGTLDRGRTRIGTGWGVVDLIIPTGDLTGDGYTDFLGRWTDGTMVLYRGNGTGGIASYTRLTTGWSMFSHLAAGDFDGNGTTDLLGVRSSNGYLSFYSGTGTGSFRSGVYADTRDWRFAEVAGIGDLTGDGRHDLLVRRSSDGGLRVYPVTGSVAVGSPISAGTYASTTKWGK
ncbi:SpoIID/LytB domain-containing protein [Intrasporangium oryzae]|uniref:SpoIID/LytB domain-containing protein n=1 Tax=Intrasporangium oryzae TaxID=412687 RepID=UPI0006869C37|nr:SpoIID/LytB domain-containing protein [Intrasporangium oryzae]